MALSDQHNKYIGIKESLAVDLFDSAEWKTTKLQSFIFLVCFWITTSNKIAKIVTFSHGGNGQYYLSVQI